MKRALIIGASGGIGSAVQSALTARGVNVSSISRREDELSLADPSSIERLMEQQDGVFDLIFVATGILAPENASPEKSLAQIDAEAMAQVMAINAIGPALILRHVPRLLPRDSRSVVAVLTARVGSIGDNHLGGWYSYRASKAAANQIVRTAAIEIARSRKQSIIVALHPGTVATPFTADYSGRDKATPQDSANHLLQVIDGLTPEQTGQFFDWAGKEVPW